MIDVRFKSEGTLYSLRKRNSSRSVKDLDCIPRPYEQEGDVSTRPFLLLPSPRYEIFISNYPSIPNSKKFLM